MNTVIKKYPIKSGEVLTKGSRAWITENGELVNYSNIYNYQNNFNQSYMNTAGGTVVYNTYTSGYTSSATTGYKCFTMQISGQSKFVHFFLEDNASNTYLKSYYASYDSSMNITPLQSSTNHSTMTTTMQYIVGHELSNNRVLIEVYGNSKSVYHAYVFNINTNTITLYASKTDLRQTSETFTFTFGNYICYRHNTSNGLGYTQTYELLNHNLTTTNIKLILDTAQGYAAGVPTFYGASSCTTSNSAVIFEGWQSSGRIMSVLYYDGTSLKIRRIMATPYNTNVEENQSRSSTHGSSRWNGSELVLAINSPTRGNSGLGAYGGIGYYKFETTNYKLTTKRINPLISGIHFGNYDTRIAYLGSNIIVLDFSRSYYYEIPFANNSFNHKFHDTNPYIGHYNRLLSEFYTLYTSEGYVLKIAISGTNGNMNLQKRANHATFNPTTVSYIGVCADASGNVILEGDGYMSNGVLNGLDMYVNETNSVTSLDPNTPSSKRMPKIYGMPSNKVKILKAGGY